MKDLWLTYMLWTIEKFNFPQKKNLKRLQKLIYSHKAGGGSLAFSTFAAAGALSLGLPEVASDFLTGVSAVFEGFLSPTVG